MIFRNALKALAVAALASGLGLSASAASANCRYAMDPGGNAFPKLYADAGYRGDGFGVHPDFESPSLYLSDEVSFGDRASSACIPAGYVLELFRGPNFGGRPLRIIGPANIPDLGRLGFDDIISSARVRRIENDDQADPALQPQPDERRVEIQRRLRRKMRSRREPSDCVRLLDRRVDRNGRIIHRPCRGRPERRLILWHR